jgi:hypothetical protein
MFFGCYLFESIVIGRNAIVVRGILAILCGAIDSGTVTVTFERSVRSAVRQTTCRIIFDVLSA